MYLRMRPRADNRLRSHAGWIPHRDGEAGLWHTGNGIHPGSSWTGPRLPVGLACVFLEWRHLPTSPAATIPRHRDLAVNRIFLYLALFALAFLVATMMLGLWLGDVRNPADTVTQRWATIHRLSGVSVGLLLVLVNSIVVTYFIGTSRWCREVVDTYQLDQEFTRRANKIKRSTFPIATISMLVAVGMVALGGAADPGASLQLEPLFGLTWANLHLIGALLGTAVIAFGFTIEWSNIEEQRALIQAILDEVRRIRVARGLDVDELATPNV